MKTKLKIRSLTSFFLARETVQSVISLQRSIKDMYGSYAPEDVKKARLKVLATDMWNSLQNEFYMTANICPNTVWEWQDRIASFDEYGYLLVDGVSCELSEWTILVKGWYKKEWGYEVLKLIKDFNLDNQPTDYVTVFMNDFKKARNDVEFSSVLLKWNDLIYWSPWKLSLYDNTFQKPLPVHYDEDFEPEVDSVDLLQF